MEYPTETKILMHLKSGSANLEEIAKTLGISKMAALKHIRHLEEIGLVERKAVKTKIGRPYYLFFYTDNAKSDFHSSDSAILNALLNYLRNNGHEDILDDFIKNRYEDYRRRYEAELGSLDPDERIKKLAVIREREYYMPELHKLSGGSYEFLERNCPIFKIAKDHPVACSLEQKLFSGILEMEVDATHRQSESGGICRFLIRKVREQ